MTLLYLRNAAVIKNLLIAGIGSNFSLIWKRKRVFKTCLPTVFRHIIVQYSRISILIVLNVKILSFISLLLL